MVRQRRGGGARFYAATFPDSEVKAVHLAPADYPSGKEGDMLTVEFTVLSIPVLDSTVGRAFLAMMEMGKIDVAKIDAARRGK